MTEPVELDTESTASTSPTDRTRRADPGAANTFGSVIRRGPFAFYVLGQTVSQLGDKLHHMALINLVGAASGPQTGGLALAQLAVVFTLPVIVFGPIAGVLVDRWEKRRTLIVCDSSRAVLVLLMPLAYRSIGLWAVYALAFGVFLLGLFFNSAKMAMIPELVTRDQLLSANAVSTFVGRFATVIGIVGGGVIVGWSLWRQLGWAGYAVGFYLDAASYVISVLTLLFVIGRPGRRRGATRTDTTEMVQSDTHGGSASAMEELIGLAHGHTPHPLSASPERESTAERVKRILVSLVRDLRETLVLIRRDERLRFVFLSVVLLALIAAAVYVLVIVSVQTVMQWGTKGVGIAGGIMAGGMILGSLAIGTFGRRWDKRRMILGGCAAIGVIITLIGVTFSFRWLAPLSFLGGVLLAPVMVAQDTLLHELAPEDSRGLIFSTRELILSASFMLLALFLGGGVTLLSKAGVREPYRLGLVAVGLSICLTGAAGWLSAGRRSAEER